MQPSIIISMDFRAGTPDTPEGEALISRLNDGIATIDDTYRQAVILDYTTRRLYHYDISDTFPRRSGPEISRSGISRR